MTNPAQSDRVTISDGTSAELTLPKSTYRALLYSEIALEFSLQVNGLDGSNTAYKRRHPGKGYKVLAFDEGDEAFDTVFVKRVNSDTGLVEIEILDRFTNLAPGQFIPTGLDVDVPVAYVGQDTITTLGTIATGTWNGDVIGPAYGGTGVANNAAATLTRSGNHALTFTTTGTTSLTLPTSGTLANQAYVDAAVVGLLDYKGGYNASTNTPDLDTSPSGVLKGDTYTVTAAGTFFTTAVQIGDVLIAEAADAAAEGDWTIVQRNETDTLATTDTAQTFTNKRVTPRVVSTATAAAPTPNADTTDLFILTALAEDPTFGAPTGTPTDGQILRMRIKDNSTVRTLTFNAIYRASSDLALPATTTDDKTLYLEFVFNAADTKWDLIRKLDNV